MGRIVLDYGGDAITASLTALLLRAAFPYRDLDLARSQDWLMMDNLKIKICTLEEVGLGRRQKRLTRAAPCRQHVLGLLRHAAGSIDAKVHLSHLR